MQCFYSRKHCKTMQCFAPKTMQCTDLQWIALDCNALDLGCWILDVGGFTEENASEEELNDRLRGEVGPEE